MIITQYSQIGQKKQQPRLTRRKQAANHSQAETNSSLGERKNKSTDGTTQCAVSDALDQKELTLHKHVYKTQQCFIERVAFRGHWPGVKSRGKQRNRGPDAGRWGCEGELLAKPGSADKGWSSLLLVEAEVTRFATTVRASLQLATGDCVRGGR